MEVIPKTKQCFKCNQIKPLGMFYKHPQMLDGHVNKCKECNKRDVKQNRAAKLDYYQEFDRLRSQKPERKARQAINYQRLRIEKPEQYAAYGKKWLSTNKEKRAKVLQDYRNRYPEKYKAHCAVNNAIRDGKLLKMPCSVCGNEKSQAHHDDYTKPLDVVWLCSRHHGERHRKYHDLPANAQERAWKAQVEQFELPLAA